MNICGEHHKTYDEIVDTCKQVPSREEIVRNDTAVNPQWSPICHSHFVETLAGAIVHNGMKILDASFALNKTGYLLVGGFVVEGPMLPKMPSDIDGRYELLVRHSNNMSHGIQVNAGVQLMACTNGCIGGTALAKHKHSSRFDIRSWAYDHVIKEFFEDCARQTQALQELKTIDCSDEQAAEIILEAGRRGVLPLARTVSVWEEWKEPVFSADDFPLNTAYKLYGDMTHVAQTCSAQRQLTIIEQSYGLIKESLACGDELLLAA